LNPTSLPGSTETITQTSTSFLLPTTPLPRPDHTPSTIAAFFARFTHRPPQLKPTDDACGSASAALLPHSVCTSHSSLNCPRARSCSLVSSMNPVARLHDLSDRHRSRDCDH
jgi:hypothetical protein